MDRKVVVVTGAGSGIGKAVAQALCRIGFAVAFAGRNRDRLESAAAGLNDVIVVPTDVTKPAEVEALFAQVAERFGRLDLLFNNAGSFGGSGAFEDLIHADWLSSVDVNLNGAFLCAQAAYRQMKSQDPRGGRIINNGSLSAHVPRPNAAAYTASKHAITGLTKAISLEGRRWNIACSQIDIGNAKTDMTDGFGSGALQANGSVKKEPLMDVENVVSTVLHMACLPLEANVQFVSLIATAMPYVGRG